MPEYKEISFSQLTVEDIESDNRVTGFPSTQDLDRFVNWLRREKIKPHLDNRYDANTPNWVFLDQLPSGTLMTGPLIKFTGSLQ